MRLAGPVDGLIAPTPFAPRPSLFVYASSNSVSPMNAIPADSLRLYARLAGLLGLATVVAGGFGEVYVPDTLIVSGDPGATAERILGHESLFRLGFASYLVEALCDATLTMLFWVLVRPVHRHVAMLMVVFRVISTCGFGASQVLYFGALTTLLNDQTTAALPPVQREAIAYLLLRIAGFGGMLFSTFYGAANVCLGWLVYRSGYIPRIFGVGIVLTGTAFAVHTFLLILAPAYASGLLLATAGIAFIPFVTWLLVRGVDAKRRGDVISEGVGRPIPD